MKPNLEAEVELKGGEPKQNRTATRNQGEPIYKTRWSNQNGSSKPKPNLEVEVELKGKRDWDRNRKTGTPGERRNYFLHEDEPRLVRRDALRGATARC